MAGGVESNFSVIFGPNLKTQTLLRPRPKLNNISEKVLKLFIVNSMNLELISLTHYLKLKKSQMANFASINI